MGALMECLVKTTFSTHYYLWKGKVHKQLEGGPIGLRATGYCAKAVMDKWLGIFESKVKEAGIKLHLITKYVDDVLIVCTNLQLGQFWEEGELHFCPEKTEEERNIKIRGHLQCPEVN